MPTFITIVMCLLITSCSTSIRFSNENKSVVHNRSNSNLRLNEVNLCAASDFVKRFPSIENEEWFKTSYGYLARFTSDEVPTNVYYDVHGNYLKSLAYFSERNMPNALKNQVNKKYPGYSMIVIAEITTEKQSAYRVSLKNNDKIKTIQVSDDNIELLSEMKNGEIAYR